MSISVKMDKNRYSTYEEKYGASTDVNKALGWNLTHRYAKLNNTTCKMQKNKNLQQNNK